jgi:putative aldouronate transport system permease protein
MEFRRVHNRGYRTFNIIGKICLILFALLCLFPFLLILIGSFTDNGEVVREGYSLFPAKWSTAAYGVVLKYPDSMLNAYKMTIMTTLIATLLGTFIITLTGYSLSRPYFRTRNFFSFLFYFTTLFSGGLIPWYLLMTKYLHVGNTIWAIILPYLMTPFNIILMRSFIRQSVPIELSESAKIDGANEFSIFMRIVIPLSTPALATIGLFLALAVWNDWYNCMLYIAKPEMYNLQYYLYELVNKIAALKEIMAKGGTSIANIDMPNETTKLAMSVFAIGPIVLVYPFVQRFFVKGLTIGAVKG